MYCKMDHTHFLFSRELLRPLTGRCISGEDHLTTKLAPTIGVTKCNSENSFNSVNSDSDSFPCSPLFPMLANRIGKWVYNPVSERLHWHHSPIEDIPPSIPNHYLQNILHHITPAAHHVSNTPHHKTSIFSLHFSAWTLGQKRKKSAQSFT